MTNEPLVLAALILAHLVADFVLQTDAIALGKFGDGRHAWNMLLAHAGLVTVTTPAVGAHLRRARACCTWPSPR